MREYCLDELFDLQMGKTPSRNNSAYWDNGSNDWVSIGDLSGFGKHVGKTKEQLTNLAVSESGIKSIPADTVIMSFKLSIGKLAITTEEIYSNEAIMAFIDKEVEIISPDYLYYLLLSRDWNEGTNKAVMGKTLNKATLSKVKIKLHEFSEQEEIVLVLDKANKLITLRKQQLEDLDNLIKSRFVEMFGDPEINNMDWVVKPLGSLCEVGSSKRIYQSEQSQDGVPFLRISDLVNRMDSGTKEYDLFIPKERFLELKEQKLVPEPGDILVTARGTLGRCYIIEENNEFYFQDGMISWLSKFDDLITALYISYLFSMPGFRRQIDVLQAGSTVAYLSIAMTKKLDVMVPSKGLQNQFAAFIQQVDKLKVTVQKALDETQQLFDSLMQTYFC